MPASTLQAGLRHRFTDRVPVERTVPHLYPDSPEMALMPEVFATGFMVGLIEWTCVQLLEPHLDWPREMTVGTHIDVSHEAATPPGMAVTVEVELVAVEGRRLRFAVRAEDEADTIARGTHERHVIDAARFSARVAEKAGGTGR
jgi:fluoroacetyl-CoA thioesterase